MVIIIIRRAGTVIGGCGCVRLLFLSLPSGQFGCCGGELLQFPALDGAVVVHRVCFQTGTLQVDAFLLQGYLCIGARVVPFRGRHDVVVRTAQQDGLQQSSAIVNLPILGNVGRAVVFEGDLEHLLVAAGEHNGTTDQHAETAPGFGPIFGGLFGKTPECQRLQIVGCERFLQTVEKGLYNRVSVLAAPCSCWLGTINAILV